MPKKPRSENYDALGSIFDFIFNEAKKRPDKRRPITPTGISGESQLTDAIISSLEKPGVFISETIINEFNSAIDVELATIKFDEVGNVKVSSNSLIDAIKDPKGFVDKAITRNQGLRKAGRARFLGSVMEDFLITGWAHKYGDLEVKTAVRGITAANEVSESYKARRAIGQYMASHSGDGKSNILNTKIPGAFFQNDFDYMADRSFNLIGRKTFGDTDWENMSNSDKMEFAEYLSWGEKENTGQRVKERFSDLKKSDILDYLTNKYGQNGVTFASNFDNATSSIKKEGSIKIFDPELYKSLEENNLSEKISGSLNGDERRLYQKTLFLLQNKNGELKKQIKTLEQEYELPTTSSSRKKELRKQIQETDKALRLLGGHTLFGQIGKWEGYINSMNQVWGGAFGTSVVPAILNGSFFDKNRNSLLNPVREENIGGVKGVYIAKTLVNPNKRDKNGKPIERKLYNTYNKMGESLYYMTPRSIFRTFFYNGEGFARALYNKLDTLNRFSSKDLSALASANVSAQEIIKEISNGEFAKLDTFVEDTLLKASGVLSKDQYKKFEKILRSATSKRKLVKAFSMPLQIQTYFKKIFSDRLKKARVNIAKWLLRKPGISRLLVKTGANKLLGQWIAGAGIKVFIKGLATALAGAVGIVGTPLASIVVTAITWVATDLFMKALGDLLVILKYVSIGVIALIFIVGAGAVSFFNKKNFSYSNATPNSVLQCTQYEETELEPGDPVPWGPGVIPPNSSEECVFGVGSYYCSQGFVDVTGWSHENYTANMPVDLTNVNYINAPQFCSTGTCTVTRIAIISCSDGSDAGGIVEFDANDGTTTYHFKLLHVVPLGVGQGDRLGGGQPVARVLNRDELNPGWCWTGMHLHLETRQNGSVVDPMELLQSFSCDVPDESGCEDPQ